MVLLVGAALDTLHHIYMISSINANNLLCNAWQRHRSTLLIRRFQSWQLDGSFERKAFANKTAERFY